MPLNNNDTSVIRHKILYTLKSIRCLTTFATQTTKSCRPFLIILSGAASYRFSGQKADHTKLIEIGPWLITASTRRFLRERHVRDYAPVMQVFDAWLLGASSKPRQVVTAFSYAHTELPLGRDHRLTQRRKQSDDSSVWIHWHFQYKRAGLKLADKLS